MRVKAQDGCEHDVSQLQMQGNKLFGILKGNGMAILLGKFESRKRTCEVMGECTCTNWNDRTASYTMPLR